MKQYDPALVAAYERGKTIRSRGKVSKAQAMKILMDRGIPIFAGGANVANVPQYPLAAPTIGARGQITVEVMLNQPTRITRMIQDITLQRFLLDELFTSDGGVTGGAVIYDMPTENDLYLNRDIQRVEPGAEFPLVTSDMPIPKTALVEKWGAKTFITDEARDRNDIASFMIEARKLGNTIVRKLNQRAVETIDQIFTDYPGQSAAGHNWTNVTTQGTNPTAYSLQPIGDFVNLQLLQEQQELGIEFDTLLMNPQEQARLQLIYGEIWRSVLTTYGYPNVFISNRVTAGTLYALARGQLGSLRIEKPLGTETWREGKTERTWTQSSVRPLMYVKNPFAVRRLTGLAG